MQYQLTRREWRFEVCALGAVPDKAKRYSKGQLYRPERATVEFSREGHGQLVLAGARVSGHRVLKNGELGDPMSETFANSHDDWPDWLQTAAIELRQRFFEPAAGELP